MFALTAAIDIAKRAHKGQIRKYTKEPYITHCFAVAGTVTSVTNNTDAFITAILHDVVEDDPNTTLMDIQNIFGQRIATYLYYLTEQKEFKPTTRKIRKEAYRKQMSNAPAIVKTIKLADIIDNIKTIKLLDPAFSQIYLKEKRSLLEVLKEGDRELFEIANNLVKRFIEG